MATHNVYPWRPLKLTDNYSKRLEAARERLRALNALVGQDASEEEYMEALREAMEIDPDLALPFKHYLEPKH
jgi:hypothetical protein